MLITILLGILLILHGLVHLLYAGQSWRLFQLRPGMLWPDGSWLFARQSDDRATRWLASISLALAALGFAIGGLGLFFQQDWWRLAAAGSYWHRRKVLLFSASKVHSAIVSWIALEIGREACGCIWSSKSTRRVLCQLRFW